VGYGSDEKKREATWPATHIVGKDILRFHAVIWPSMLMAAGLPVPHQVYGHGWLLVGGEKMSKSKLTGIAPTDITDTFGSDAFRYYFMSAISFGQDGSFSWEDLSARYQAELANGFGNLASRSIAMVAKYFDGVVPAAAEMTTSDLAIKDVVAAAAADADAAMENLAIHDAISSIWTIVDALNGYITEQEPWALAKDPANAQRLGTVLNTAIEGLRALAVLLSPVMPQTTSKLWAALGVESALGMLQQQNVRDAGEWGQVPAGTKLGELEPLFPRIESSVE
jgi:methionyl-tRNA synthetase